MRKPQASSSKEKKGEKNKGGGGKGKRGLLRGDENRLSTEEKTRKRCGFQGRNGGGGVGGTGKGEKKLDPTESTGPGRKAKGETWKRRRWLGITIREGPDTWEGMASVRSMGLAGRGSQGGKKTYLGEKKNQNFDAEISDFAFG